MQTEENSPAKIEDNSPKQFATDKSSPGVTASMLGEQNIEMYGDTFTLQICYDEDTGTLPATARLSDPRLGFPKAQAKGDIDAKEKEEKRQHEKKEKEKERSPKKKMENKRTRDWTGAPRVSEGPLAYVQRPGGNAPKGKYKVVVNAPGIRGRTMER